MIRLSNNVTIPDSELEFTALRSRGAGGQNVNKVSSAIQLRFDVPASSLPAFYKGRLLKHADRRISSTGVIVIKADEYRSQERNREAAIERLVALIRSATRQQKPRRPTKPSKAARKKRTDSKTHRGKVKALRGKVDPN